MKSRKIRNVAIIIFILLIIFLVILIIFYKIERSRTEPNYSYIVAKEYFGAEKFTTFEKDELETNNITIELKDLALSVLWSAFENDGNLSENFKNIVSTELFSKIDVGHAAYGEEKVKNNTAYETCNFKIFRIYLSEDKSIVEYDYSYALYETATNKTLNSSMSTHPFKKDKLFLELSSENVWIITDLLTYP